MKTITVLIVDDHPLFVQGIRAILAEEDNIQIIAEAGDGLQAIEMVKERKPAIAIMDITMPNMDGIEATKKIKTISPETRVIALSIHSGKHFVKDMIAAGASGYLLKDSAPDELVIALHKIASGDMYLSSAITHIALMKDEPEPEPRSHNILYTKLHKPSVTSDYVLRQELINKLENNKDRPFTLVSASAGYGKSMLVSSWLGITAGSSIWISLGNEDNDLRVFLNYLHIALENTLPGSVPNLALMMQGAELPPLRIISETLLNDLDEIPENFVLVLDDYHLINDDKIHDLMNAILRFPAQNMHLVIISRRDPPLSLNTLRAHNRMNEIRMKELSFREAEITSLFQNILNVELADETIKQLMIKTEGWIVGLRLVSLIVDKEENQDRILQNIDGDIFTISEFLLEEVLMKQPSDIHNLLLTTSIYNRFCADLIDNVQPTTGQNGSKEISSGTEFLNWLMRSNLFIVSLDDKHEWFRYHHLFQELLHSQLMQKMSPDLISKLHQSASQWFESQRLIEEALEHKLAARDELAGMEIIEKHAHHEFIHGVFRIHKWLNSIPEQTRHNSPKIILIEAWQAFGQFQLEKIPALLEKAESLLEGKPIEAQLKAEIDFFHGNFQYWTGDTKASIKTLEQALSHTDNLPVHIYGNIKLILNMALQREGCYESIIPGLLQELKGVDRSGGYQFAYTYGSLTFAYLLQGHLKQSIDNAHQWRNHTLQINAHYFQAWSDWILAMANFHSYKLDTALDHLKSTYEKRYILDLRATIDNMAGMVLVFHFKNEPLLSQNSLQNLIKFSEEHNDPQTFLIAQSVNARHALLQGDIKSAMIWADSFNEKVDFSGIFFWLEVPWITRAKILVNNGTEESLITAILLLKELLEVSISSNLHIQIPEIKILLALAYQKQGNSEKSQGQLKEAVLLSSSEEMIRPFIEAGPEIKAMLEVLRPENPEMHFIDTLLTSIDHFHLKTSENLEKSTFRMMSGKKESSRIIDTESLTVRENEVLALVAEGLRNKEIASKLFVSEITIKKHLSNIFRKLNVKNRITLINKAKEEGLIQP